MKPSLMPDKEDERIEHFKGAVEDMRYLYRLSEKRFLDDTQHYKAALEETRDFNKYLIAQCRYWEDKARQAEAELEKKKK